MTLAQGARRRAAPKPDRRRRRGTLWLGLVAVAVLTLVTARVVDLPGRVDPAAATLLGAALAAGLATRAGGRVLLPALLALAYGAWATLTLWPVLLTGGAVAVAVVAALLGLLVTTPARTFGAAILEVLIACAVATVGGLGVAGFSADVRLDRFGYVVLAVSLVAAFALVYRLGAGFHGLGRRGYLVAVGALLLLVLAIAYSEALSRWGAPQLIDRIDDTREFMRAHLDAVPHPIEALLGIPALCWGVFMRARRRQGWWVCAFGAAVTAPSTTRFLTDGVPAGTAVLSAIYSLVVGLALGFLVIRLDLRFTGSRGRRARHEEEADAHRPEPGRFDALQ